MRMLARLMVTGLLVLTVTPAVAGAASARNGGDVIVPPSQAVTDDQYLAGNNVRIEGAVTGDVVAAARSVVVTGRIGGTLAAEVGRTLELQPGAAIVGNLAYTAPAAITPPPGVTIGGRSDFTQRTEEPSREGLLERIRGNVYWLAASLILLIGILLYARKAAVRGAGLLRARPGISLLAGLGFIVLTPLAVGFLVLSLVGLPLAFFTVAGYLLVIYTAKLFPALLIGGLILQRKPDSFWMAFGAGAIGLVLYYLLIAIPVLGGMVAVLTVLFGTGAQLLLGLQVYADNKKKYGV